MVSVEYAAVGFGSRIHRCISGLDSRSRQPLHGHIERPAHIVSRGQFDPLNGIQQVTSPVSARYCSGSTPSIAERTLQRRPLQRQLKAHNGGHFGSAQCAGSHGSPPHRGVIRNPPVRGIYRKSC